jgi:hydroxymethylpyrimidine pyrophosphatase-like HAD family hydrolase
VTHLLEIFALRSDKWTMVERVRDDLGLARHRVVAVGDGLNDMTMLREAPLSVAMANADPRVLAHADHVAPHHAQDGFAAIAERLLDGSLAMPEPDA